MQSHNRLMRNFIALEHGTERNHEWPLSRDRRLYRRGAQPTPWRDQIRCEAYAARDFRRSPARPGAATFSCAGRTHCARTQCGSRNEGQFLTGLTRPSSETITPTSSSTRGGQADKWQALRSLVLNQYGPSLTAPMISVNCVHKSTWIARDEATAAHCAMVQSESMIGCIAACFAACPDPRRV